MPVVTEESEMVVLIIDDEESMRSACAETLTREGYQVHTAADGEAGLEVAGQVAPDVVFVDLKMPKMGGMAVLEELTQVAPEAVKVVITAYATASTARGAFTSGADDFLPKPFTPDELRLTAARALQHREYARKSHQAEMERRAALAGEVLSAAEDAAGCLESIGGLDGEAAEQLKKARAILDGLAETARNWQEQD